MAKTIGFGKLQPGKNRPERLAEIAEMALRQRADRDAGYREQSLRLHPWVCARCGREFTRENLLELTVHHKDHNHDNNPPDGSNWENLCVYCHDNEHTRYLDHLAAKPASKGRSSGPQEALATHNPFGNLKELLQRGRSGDGDSST